MQFRNVIHQPVIGAVAAGAIIPNSILVNIGMTGITVGLSFLKKEAAVAFPAIQNSMLAVKRELRFVVLKKAGIKWQSKAGGVA